jgi:uncharacterized repeat protein (TIGR02543 family)
MKKILYIALLLVAAQGAWAIQSNYFPHLMNPTPSEGPWTYDAFNSLVAKNQDPAYRSFNDLNHSAWDDEENVGTIQKQNKQFAYNWYDWSYDGLGFYFYCIATSNSHYILYSTYYHRETLPPYTRKQLIWDYALEGWFDVNFCVALFAHEDMGALKNLPVYATYKKNEGNGDNRIVYNHHSNPYCICYAVGDFETCRKTDTKVFDFDNRNGSNTTVKSWNLLMSYVAYVSEDDYDDCVNYIGYSSFQNLNEKWTTFYYKHLNFDANGGIGTMATQEIENSGNLKANAFTRAGYAFQGWATSADGAVVFTDGQAITATAEDKGPVTLYAVWKPTVANVIAAIDAIGNVVYTAECNAHIDDVRALYNMLSAEDKSAVTNYSTLVAAEATYLAIQNVVTKITAIGEVTAASGDAIAAARAAYNELTEAQKPLVINYSALVDAEAQYAILPVVAAIGAIGEVTAESGKAIADARAAYDALSNTQKSQVTNYATLLAAEAAYADLGKTTVLYVDKAGTDTIHTQRKAINYPALPEDAIYWQTVEKSASDNTIVIKAVE